MRPAITLRLGQAADAPAIAAMSRQLAEAGLREVFTAARVGQALADRATNVVVACENERIVGVGIMEYALTEARLALLAVQPEARGAGLGRRLLEWLERPAILGGASVIWLEVRASNPGAREFYRRRGYRQVAVLAGYYDGREAAIRMGRELGA